MDVELDLHSHTEVHTEFLLGVVGLFFFTG